MKQVVRDLNLELEIRVVPTVRDADGLALSSRNALLSAEERARALAIPRALATRDPERARAVLAEAGIEPGLRRRRRPRRADARRRRPRRLDPPDRQRPPGRRAHDEHPPAHARPVDPGAREARRCPELGRDEAPRRPDQRWSPPTTRPAALLADEAGVELILVGDTAAMVMLGHESTIPVTLDEMIFLTRAVTRAARRPLVIGDLPFGTYEVSDEQAVASAIRLVKEGGADVVKLEGAGRMVSRVRAIAESNIGVMGHVGLTPQSATKLGGFRAQGRTADAALKLYDDALALQDAGCFAIVLEAVPAPVAARDHARRSTIPTIGIGAGAGCDGQVLVWHDLLGLYAGRDAALRQALRGARRRDRATRSSSYVADVRSGAFPEEQHTYSIPDEELARFEDALDERG